MPGPTFGSSLAGANFLSQQPGGVAGQELETESAQNLFSKAQIHEVIKGLNVSQLFELSKIHNFFEK